MLVTEKYEIRNYTHEDAEQIGHFNKILELSYLYNKDFTVDNIYCVVNEINEICGVGHLEADQSWGLIDKVENNFTEDTRVYSLILNMSFNDTLTYPLELKDRLIKTLIERAYVLRKQYPNRKVSLKHYISSDNSEEMDYYLSKGFVSEKNHMIMERDLNEKIPYFPLPDQIKIKNWEMETIAEQQQYLKAEAEGDLDGLAWSIHRLQWFKGGPEWDTFTAFDGDKVVGSVMTWGIGENGAATESIFVLPSWRRRGIAKAVVTQALKFLKEKGKETATLCVLGHNKNAIALYQSLGYKVKYINVEFELQI
ncbi:GNAT family N-acetyltransferase [Chengkuizengella axinellae]|uniref:GNAT family N-acetyltransferase n=1 Tax=Chengkuizengella axinellae TaxID=3064388 RepID=A0ABT9IVM6_9BACL|nr:GNAT family N-acetyltransferase [Chengkuizengella sp. 2205SS18-9]MDP5272864.1 GNAT family N-acetyltransferase [Chengkuizengella sp. 2205SS18-9]